MGLLLRSEYHRDVDVDVDVDVDAGALQDCLFFRQRLLDTEWTRPCSPMSTTLAGRADFAGTLQEGSYWAPCLQVAETGHQQAFFEEFRLRRGRFLTSRTLGKKRRRQDNLAHDA